MKVKISLILLPVLAISSLLFNQCGKYTVLPDVCFNKNILPIFISKCTTDGCHGGTGKSGSSQHERGNGGGNFTTYEGIMQSVKPYHPLLSNVYTQCRGNNPSMPPREYAQLTSKELEYIKYWIHIGAKQECNALPCDTLNVTYSARIEPLISSWCVGCHNPSNAGGGFDLSTYNGLKASITPTNRLIGSINHWAGYKAMPQGAGMLDACDLRAVQIWVDAGFPNN